MSKPSRRTVLGASLAGAGAAMSGCSIPPKPGKPAQPINLEGFDQLPRGLSEAASFPLVEAIAGRRSRRFAKGTEIPLGPLAYKSSEAAAPLSELEQMMLLTAISGQTGWANLIPYKENEPGYVANYMASATGRTFPSAAGFQTSEVFFTDDNGTYIFETRDLRSDSVVGDDTPMNLSAYLNRHRTRIKKLSEGRLNTPATPQHMETHNEWCANVPGSTLIIPVCDLAQHHILNLCYIVQNGAGIYDDIRGQAIPGLETFDDVIAPDQLYPMSYVDQMSLTEVTVETTSGLYAGALMLQALGLGGWMYGGINQLSILGASGDPDVPGLGFQFDHQAGWPVPNVTGLEGIFEGHCPPHFPSMRDAVEHVVDRKFGANGPYNAATPGPYRQNAKARSAATRHSARFVECVTTICDYIFKEYGKFPASIPSIFTMMYLQAHQLDRGFYDEHFGENSYLRTHRDHDRNWTIQGVR